MQTVCDQKFYGTFSNSSDYETTCSRMPEHERLLARQLFWGGLTISCVMLLAIQAFGLY